MGFWPLSSACSRALPTKRQTLLFSATMSSAIEKIARSTMREPKVVEVSQRGLPPRTVDQTAYPVAMESKTALLLDLLERERFERVLVFTRTRRGAERLSHILEARSHKVNRIHADRTQPQREAALRGFKDGQTRVLVATDIAARGIDVDSISQSQLRLASAPKILHRIGRTGTWLAIVAALLRLTRLKIILRHRAFDWRSGLACHASRSAACRRRLSSAQSFASLLAAAWPSLLRRDAADKLDKRANAN